MWSFPFRNNNLNVFLFELTGVELTSQQYKSKLLKLAKFVKTWVIMDHPMLTLFQSLIRFKHVYGHLSIVCLLPPL